MDSAGSGRDRFRFIYVWDFSNHLRSLPGAARGAALDAQDALTGALGRAILAAA